MSDKLPQNPTYYKTRFGLYRATVRVLESSPSCKKAWWLKNAAWYCSQEMPDLLPQLQELINSGSPQAITDLIPIGNSMCV